jgi:hypothetical protein
MPATNPAAPYAALAARKRYAAARHDAQAARLRAEADEFDARVAELERALTAPSE